MSDHTLDGNFVLFRKETTKALYFSRDCTLLLKVQNKYMPPESTRVSVQCFAEIKTDGAIWSLLQATDFLRLNGKTIDMSSISSAAREQAGILLKALGSGINNESDGTPNKVVAEHLTTYLQLLNAPSTNSGQRVEHTRKHARDGIKQRIRNLWTRTPRLS